MKKFIYIIMAAALTFQSCNLLDFDETSGVYDRDDMYETYSYAQRMLTNIYSYMPQDLGTISDAMRDCGSDDAEFGDPDGKVQRFNNGNWSAVSTVDDKWSLYNGIRCVSEFLESIEKVDFSKYYYDSKYERQMEHVKTFPYQARVLRAFYLFELARRYGDIPVPMKMLSIEEANSIHKTPFDQVIEFIVAECDECAPNLPLTYIGMLDDEYGRATRGFAMAVKTKALLYAASKLHNPEMDPAKWKRAALAAQDVINLGIYVLDSGDKVNTTSSPENILVRMNSESSSFEEYNFPVRFTEGQRTYMSGTYPTQNLVDAFQTINGYDVTLTANGWESNDPDFDPQNPYDNRDPRFARTILANGMDFKGTKIETFVGGADYSATRSDLGTCTGYYLRKYINEATSFTPEAEASYKHHWVIYRYAETLLTYAEAANEYFKNPTSTDAELTMSALEALNQVRMNAQMPGSDASDYNSFVEAVRREWRVEFAFEDHRFWDVRRWNIGATTQTQVDGVSIVKTGAGFDYARTTVEKRTWADRMNLYPIPKSELFSNPNLNPQNTGW